MRTDGPDASGGHHQWRARHGWGPPRHRPPWWPDGEAWPPERPEAWRLLRRRFARRAAGFAAVLLLALVLIVAAAIWLLTTAFGGGWISVVLVVALLLIFASIMRRVVRGVRLAVTPMGELIEASGRVEAGEFGTQVAEHGPRELRTLTRAFNSMSSRLAANDAERRRLVADVSHELRTPLTVIQGNIEGMLDGLYPADRAHLERLLAETHQMERLIEDLRTLSLAEAGALALTREPNDLGALASEVATGFEPQALAAGVQIAVEKASDPPDLELDSLRIRQVLTNLVSNAVRHTPSGGRVTIAVQEEAGGALLRVSDTGTGMDAEAVTHAFDRFWRSADSPGAGLGLAIVRDLVAAHGGRVEIASSVEGGTSVACHFPAA